MILGRMKFKPSQAVNIVSPTTLLEFHPTVPTPHTDRKLEYPSSCELSAQRNCGEGRGWSWLQPDANSVPRGLGLNAVSSPGETEPTAASSPPGWPRGSAHCEQAW